MKRYICAATKSFDDEDFSTQLQIARNPNVRMDVMWKLADSSNTLVQEAVATNKNAPADLLAHMAGDRNSSLRIAIAENPNTSPDTLRLLAQDGRSHVISAVAKNPNTPSDILYKWAEDADYIVKEAVMRNPALPIVFRKNLASQIGCYTYVEVSFTAEYGDNFSLTEGFDALAAKIQNLLLRLGYCVSACSIEEDDDQSYARNGYVFCTVVIDFSCMIVDEEADKVEDIVAEMLAKAGYTADRSSHGYSSWRYRV